MGDNCLKKKHVKEEFCISCERSLLTESEQFGPICPDCYKMTRQRKDPRMKSMPPRRLVTLVPSLCPHEEGCKFDRIPPRHFNIIVFDERLEPIKIEGPYPKRIAEQEAKLVQEKLNKRRKK
jgi:predicted RNA-binding Zn-ribbon protein involved in translation (DUF1610 family)